MSFETLDLSIENSSLFSLQTVKVEENYLAVPNKAFPVGLLSQVSAVYSGLTSQELDPEANTILANYEDGSLKRIYGPRVFLNGEGDSLQIRWGQEYLQLSYNPDDQCFYSPNGELALEVAEGQVGRYPQLCLQGAVEANDDSILTFNFPIALSDYENPPVAKAITTLLKKKGFQAVASHFSAPKEGNSDSSPVYNASKCLMEGTYPIEDWVMRKSKTEGDTLYIVTLANANIITEEGEELLSLETAKIWAPAKLKQAIEAGLKKEGATFSRVNLKGDKFKYEIEGEYKLSSDSLDLSWL